MKRIVTLLMILSIGSFSFSFADECSDLIAKYHAPDPATKTMRQLKRWIKRKVKRNDPNRQKLEQCLISRAADNPNQATVAGE